MEDCGKQNMQLSSIYVSNSSEKHVGDDGGVIERTRAVLGKRIEAHHQ